MRFKAHPFALILMTCPTILLAAEPPTQEAYSRLPNLIQNGSFEMDWMHNKISAYTRFMLLEQSDWGYSHADAIPDSWVVRGNARQDLTTGKFGPGSLRINGEASQVV